MMSTNTLQHNVLRKMILCIAELAPWNHTREWGHSARARGGIWLIRSWIRVRKRKLEGSDDSRYHMYCKFITNLPWARKELTQDCRGKTIRAKQSSSMAGMGYGQFSLGPTRCQCNEVITTSAMICESTRERKRNEYMNDFQPNLCPLSGSCCCLLEPQDRVLAGKAGLPVGRHRTPRTRSSRHELEPTFSEPACGDKRG